MSITAKSKVKRTWYAAGIGEGRVLVVNAAMIVFVGGFISSFLLFLFDVFLLGRWVEGCFLPSFAFTFLTPPSSSSSPTEDGSMNVGTGWRGFLETGGANAAGTIPLPLADASAACALIPPPYYACGKGAAAAAPVAPPAGANPQPPLGRRQSPYHPTPLPSTHRFSPLVL